MNIPADDYASRAKISRGRHESHSSDNPCNGHHTYPVYNDYPSSSGASKREASAQAIAYNARYNSHTHRGHNASGYGSSSHGGSSYRGSSYGGSSHVRERSGDSDPSSSSYAYGRSREQHIGENMFPLQSYPDEEGLSTSFGYGPYEHRRRRHRH